MYKRILIITLAAIGLSFLASSCVKESELEGKVKDIVQLDSLNARMAALEAQMQLITSDISSLKMIVAALQENLYVTKVEQSSEGFSLTFSDGTSVSVKNGTNGKNGTDGKDAPVIGVKKDTDGIYYWTLKQGGKTDWLCGDDGKKIRVTGEKGDTGAQGPAGKEVGVKDSLSVLYWVLVDKSKTPIDSTWVTDNAGNKIKAVGKDGDSFFSKVETHDDYVVLTFASGTKIELPYKAELDKLVARIQKIEPVSDYRDGSVIIANGERTAEFFVTPDSLASKLADGFKANKTKFTFLAYRTLTKATIFDTLRVTKVTGANGILQVTIDGSTLPSAFVHDSVSYNGYLKVSDTVNSALTGTFPLIRPIYPEAESLECVTIKEVTWAPVNCGYDKDNYKYGKLYQWGRAKGCGYQGSDAGALLQTTTEAKFNSTTHINDSLNVAGFNNWFYTNGLDISDWYANDASKLLKSWPMKSGDAGYIADKIANPCPSGWRVPTAAELTSLLGSHTSGNLQDGTGVYSGMKGKWFDGSTSSTPTSGVFLPAAGERGLTNGNARGRGSNGLYWSSSVDSSDARDLFFSAGSAGKYTNKRACGFSVRCVQE